MANGRHSGGDAQRDFAERSRIKIGSGYRVGSNVCINDAGRHPEAEHHPKAEHHPEEDFMTTDRRLLSFSSALRTRLCAPFFSFVVSKTSNATSTIVAVLSIITTALPAAAVEPDDLVIGPVNYQQDVNGVSVNLSARTYFKIQTIDNKIFLKAQVIGDLGDLQKKIGAIVDTFRLPAENCKSYSANNPVVSVPRKELLFRDTSAVFSIGGSVTMWDCRENPIPNSKVDWVIENIGLGIKTKVPKVVTWPGSPIKNKLVTQPFDADLPIALVRLNESAVALTVGRPDIELKGQYVFITKGILNIAGIDVNQKAQDALNKAIDPEKLKLAIPAEFQEFNPSIDSARFIDDGGQLAAEINMSALIPAAKVTAMIKDLIDKKPHQ